MAGNRLTVCEQELLWVFARLISISSNFLSGNVREESSISLVKS